MKSQRELILDYLLKGHKLTAIKALYEFGSLRLASRVSELRGQGHNIKSEIVRKGEKFVAEYSLNK